MIDSKVLQPLALAALVAMGASAHAGFATYTTEADFLAQVSQASTDTFADLAGGELAASLARSAGAYGYTVASAGGLYGAGSDAGRWLSNNDRRDAISFSGFSGGATAIGGLFFGTNDLGSVLANQTLRITVTDTALNESTTLLSLNSATAFFGVVSSAPLLSLSIAVDEGNLLAAWPTIGGITVAVPEPSTYALMLAGVGALAWTVRRRRSAG
ncbi:PEP-CTERM sorting domain-containing protein [Aquincola sp. MAHUQ-54]|uniref:PEP-CTERM sorting domain-containing protein n=1 Tax=Aquincola agrisoli TaxID=3119538 RepID=A0AAW9Q2E2_9BURK